jgi:PST family polysaccharide transporter
MGALVGQAWGLTGVGWGVFAAVTLNYALAAWLAMRATSIGLGALASAHVPGLVFSVVVALQLWVMRDVVIGHEAPAALIVVLCAASSTGTMLVALRALPVLVPCADYPAIVAAVLRIVPKPARPLARRGLGAPADDPNAGPGRDGTTGDHGTRAAVDVLSGPAVVRVVE